MLKQHVKMFDQRKENRRDIQCTLCDTVSAGVKTRSAFRLVFFARTEQRASFNTCLVKVTFYLFYQLSCALMEKYLLVFRPRCFSQQSYPHESLCRPPMLFLTHTPPSTPHKSATHLSIKFFSYFDHVPIPHSTQACGLDVDNALGYEHHFSHLSPSDKGCGF